MANQHHKNIIASNKKILRGYLIGFVIVALLSFVTKLIVNKVKNREPFIPEIEGPFMWNAVVYALLMLRAYTSSRPRKDQGGKGYRPGKDLYKSTLIELVILSIIVQYFVIFTPYALFLYILVPVYGLYFLISKALSFF